MPRPAKPKAELSSGSLPIVSLNVSGQNRTCAVYSPKNPKAIKLAMVMVFHGGLSNADYAARMSDMNTKAELEGFMAVYPNGSGEPGAKALTWNAWNCCGYAADHQVEDVRFISLLIDKMTADYPVDPAKVYATGFSNGAMLCHRLAAELGDKIAAIAPVAGAFNADLKPEGVPVAVMMIHGKEDLHVQIQGGVPQRTFAPSNRTDKPLAHAVDYWVKRNGCGAVPREEVQGRSRFTVYEKGRGGSEVCVCIIEGQGHSWPGGKQGLHYGNIDVPVQDVSATNLMWDFFKHHSK